MGPVGKDDRLRYINQSLQFTCQIKENKMIYLIVAVANLQQTVFLTIK